MRQIGIATIRHCDSHDGEFPEWWHAKRSWTIGRRGTLALLAGTVPRRRGRDSHLPSDPLADERLQSRATSYVINDYLAANVEDAARNLRQVETTHRTMLVFEAANETKVGPQYEHVHAADWFSEFNIQNDFVMWSIERELQIDRHHETANYVFLDGHVETISAAQIEQWVAERFEFARPQ